MGQKNSGATHYKAAAVQMMSSGVEALPRRFRTRLFGEHWDWTRADTDSHIHPDLNKEQRLFIGMANFAGQGHAWAKAVRESGLADARNAQPSLTGTHLVFESDSTVPQNVWRISQRWAKEQFRVLTNEYTSALIESARPIIGAYCQGNTETQIEKLLDSGMRAALLWHGSDIRSPEIHTQWVKDSPFTDPLDGLTAALEQQAAKNREMADRLGLQEFVSTPHLLTYRPDAIWLPILTNSALWVPVEQPPIRTETRPRVVHVPSKSAMKGTRLIQPVLQALAQENIIDYVELSGVAPTDMPQAIGTADIVVELLGMNSYGTAAIEAMSQGIPVVGQVGTVVRDRVIERTGLDVPIAEADSESLRDVIVSLASNPDLRMEIAQSGLRFIEQVHSPVNVAETLNSNLIMH